MAGIWAVLKAKRCSVPSHISPVCVSPCLSTVKPKEDPRLCVTEAILSLLVSLDGVTFLDGVTSALFYGTSLQLETEFVSCDSSLSLEETRLASSSVNPGLGCQQNTRACY